VLNANRRAKPRVVSIWWAMVGVSWYTELLHQLLTLYGTVTGKLTSMVSRSNTFRVQPVYADTRTAVTLCPQQSHRKLVKAAHLPPTQWHHDATIRAPL
jgi:hypothetical protein